MELRKDFLQEGSDTKGGYLVQDIYRKVEEIFLKYGLARQLFGTIPLGKTDTVKVTTQDSSNITAYVVSEGGTTTESQQAYSQVSVSVIKLSTAVPITQELVEDANEDVIMKTFEAIAIEFAKKEDEMIFTNTESASLEALLTAATTTEALGGAYIDGDTISKLIATLQGYGGLTQNMALVVNATTLHYIRTLKDDNGNYLFNMNTAQNPLLKTGVVGMIFGVPIFVSSVISVTDATPDTSIGYLLDRRCAELYIRKELSNEIERVYSTDSWKLWTRERLAFKTVRPNLVVYITGIKSED